MKITVEHIDTPENQVILRCKELDDEMLWVLSMLRSGLQKLCAWREGGEMVLLRADEVIYCDTVEEKTFVYTAAELYQTALSLGELEGRYGEQGFFRVGKSMVVNLHHIRSLKSHTAGRIEITLETKERLMVSRHYAPLLRERLEL